MRSLILFVILTMCFVAPVLAQEGDAERSTLDDQQSVSITIYNSNLGLVKDVRKLRLPRGVVDLRFEGVAATIDATSVHIRSLDHSRDLAVLEQNFEYDLISPQKLMEKYLGQTVELITLKDDKETITRAKLIGNQGGYVYEMDGKIAINPPGRVVLPEIPDGLISKPTLVWLLDNGRREHTVEASYLTGGINWKANYVLVLSNDDKSIDLSGWVTINNQSGATYNNATLKLVAGDVNRAPVARDLMMNGRRHAGMAAKESSFQEQAFFEYHLYTLDRPSTIKNNQIKQISLLDAENAKVAKTYVYSPVGQYWFSQMSGSDRATKVGVFLSFENSETNNLGMPLPKGVIRVYKRDADQELQFIGEDGIDHTPKDETIRVKMGEAFDIVGERKQTTFRVLQSGHLYESSYEIELRNHKEEDVVIQVVEIIPGDWEITQKSHDFEKETSTRVLFSVPVAKDGVSKVTYTVRVRY